MRALVVGPLWGGFFRFSAFACGGSVLSYSCSLKNNITQVVDLYEVNGM